MWSNIFEFEFSRMKFKNELEAIKVLFSENREKRRISLMMEISIKRLILNGEAKETDSNELRELGNLIVRSSNGDMRKAAKLYTDAILIAPGGSQALAFAHANRSTALRKLGYFQAAYDDCVCALKEGYPKEMSPKILIRQAQLAKDLNNVEKLQKHVLELESMVIEPWIMQQLTDFKSFLMAYKSVQEDGANCVVEDLEYHGSHKIVCKPGTGERCVIATKPIKQGEKIFVDRLFGFTPIKKHQICDECAAMAIIPFPCYECYGDVSYCSLKCKEKHANIHKFECTFIQAFRTEDVCVELLFVLRVLLQGLPELLPVLKPKRNANALWSKCFENKESSLNNKYLQILKQPNLNDIKRQSLEEAMLHSEVVVTLLKECTSFFDFVSDAAAPAMEWEIFIAALILRHLCQIEGILEVISSVVDRDMIFLSPRIDKGHLFRVIDYQLCAVAAVPIISSCNHQCEPVFNTFYNGRFATAIAQKDISKGDEITDCVDNITSKQYPCKVRQSKLKLLGLFCKCKKCIDEDPDKDFVSISTKKS